MKGSPGDWQSGVVKEQGSCRKAAPLVVGIVKSVLLLVLLLAAGLVATMPRRALAQAAGYVFTPIAFLGDRAPAPPKVRQSVFVNDFEGWAINSHGDVFFAADLGNPSGKFIGEGLFLGRSGQISPIAYPGQSAPGGGAFDGFFIGPIALNNEGDMAFPYVLQPPGSPVGVNSGARERNVCRRHIDSPEQPGRHGFQWDFRYA